MDEKKHKKHSDGSLNSYTFCPGDFYIQNNSTLQNKGTGEKYSFYPNDVTGDMEFTDISLNIMDNLLRSYTVVTYIYASYSPVGNNHMYWWKESFPYRNYRFLSAYKMTDNAFFDGEKRIATVTSGINHPIMKLLLDSEAYEFEGNECILFGYSACIEGVSTFTDIEAVITAKTFELSIEYYEQHDHLIIAINTEKISIDNVISVIKGVCEKHGKMLHIKLD